MKLSEELRSRSVVTATPSALKALSEEERASSAVIVADAFIKYYDPSVLLALIDFLKVVGVRPWLAPYKQNGKPLHVHGFLRRFARVARENSSLLLALEDTGVELIGVDPSMTLTYRSEYKSTLSGERLPNVHLIQEWLVERLHLLPRLPDGKAYRFIPHCTEQSTATSAVLAWKSVFNSCGLDLKVEVSGCCGMAGAFGHETEHREVSERIYSQSWAIQVARANAAALLADGFSCRSQVASIDGIRLKHPIEALLAEWLRVGDRLRKTNSNPR